MSTLKLKKKERREVIQWAVFKYDIGYGKLGLNDDARLDALVDDHQANGRAVALLEEARRGTVTSMAACQTLIGYAKARLEDADLFYGRHLREGGGGEHADWQRKRARRIASLLERASRFKQELRDAEEDSEDLADGMSPEEIAVVKEAWQAHEAIETDSEYIADAVSAMLRKDSDFSAEGLNEYRRRALEDRRRFDEIIDKALTLVPPMEVPGD